MTTRMTYDPNEQALVFQTPYCSGLIAELKVLVPSTERRWDRDRKVWLVAPCHAQKLASLAHKYLGIVMEVPMMGASGPIIEARVMEVHYIGATKDRGNGERSAYALVNDEWNAVFPESVLLRWFGIDIGTHPQAATTLYAALGVRQGANNTEIKKAYRRAALQWHPDRCSEPDAVERFQCIQHAYEVLRDPRLRGRYDAGLVFSTQVERDEPFKGEMGFRAPLRCGILLVKGMAQLGRFVVDEILAWEDIINELGQTLVTSWPVGGTEPEKRWA